MSGLHPVISARQDGGFEAKMAGSKTRISAACLKRLKPLADEFKSYIVSSSDLMVICLKK